LTHCYRTVGHDEDFIKSDPKLGIIASWLLYITQTSIRDALNVVVSTILSTHLSLDAMYNAIHCEDEYKYKRNNQICAKSIRNALNPVVSTILSIPSSLDALYNVICYQDETQYNNKKYSKHQTEMQ